MKFNTLIFLIIAFNIAMALLRQRAKKARSQREEAEPAPALPPIETKISAQATPSSPLALKVEAPIPVAAESASAKRPEIAPPSPFAVQLRERKSIQAAWILKEILDPPLVLRRR